jgi:hypothetical protein
VSKAFLLQLHPSTLLGAFIKKITYLPICIFLGKGLNKLLAKEKSSLKCIKPIPSVEPLYHIQFANNIYTLVGEGNNARGRDLEKFNEHLFKSQREKTKYD